MSHSILYRAMFIKLDDGTFIPMVEAGDNNVYESLSPRRRAREWEALRWVFEDSEQKKRYSLTREEILRDAEYEVESLIKRHVGVSDLDGKLVTEADVRKNFFYFSSIRVVGQSMTSASQFLNFIKSGFRNAVTMDEVSGEMRFVWYDGPNHCHSAHVNSEEELARVWNEHLDANSKHICLDCVDGLFEEVRLRNRRARRPRAQRDGNAPSFVVSFKGTDCGLRYLYRLTRRGIQHIGEPTWAHKYSSYRGAMKAAESIERRFPERISDACVVQL